VDLEIFRFTLEEELTMGLRLVFAGLAGGIVGLERRHAGRNIAGIRTLSLVSIGAAVFTLVSIYGFVDLFGEDPSRVASSVAAGVGFIGAGAIVRQGAGVRGITTAAAIWAAAALGMAAATGMFVLALSGAILTAVTLGLIPRGDRTDLEDSGD
jgi:putative Mg2+ transporter-C (MgtC) family protein